MTVRRPLLLPLVPLYAAAQALDRRRRKLVRGNRRALENAVISIGSLSAGGAGKTPFVLLLAGILRQREYAVRILTRGYGRTGKAVEQVDPHGDPARFGDEPILLAQRTGAPVFVGADRYQAGLLAEQLSDPVGRTTVHLLDDGFQHRALARDIDIVLLTRKDVHDTLLPAGDLREPLTALRRADIIVLREDEAEDLEATVTDLTLTSAEASLPRNPPPQPRPIWRTRRSLHLPEAATRSTGARPLAFCAIARPESFTTMLRAQGLHPVQTLTFRDHHPYTGRDIDRLLAAARQAAATGFVTTEKDAVKLAPAMRTHLEQAGPLLVAELSVALVDERAAMEQILSLIPRLDRRRHR